MSTRVSATSVEKYQVLLRAGGHAWLGDEPPEIGGDGLGPDPFEQLLGSLGACLATTVNLYASKSRIPLQRLWADLEGDWVKDGKEKKYHIKVGLRARGDLGEKDLERLRRYAEQCPVHGIISQGAEIEISLEKV